MTHQGLIAAALAALVLTGCDPGSKPPESGSGDTQKNSSARGRDKLPDLAAVPTVEICSEHIADSHASGIVVEARLPPCDGCSFEGASATIDRDYDTVGTLRAATGTEKSEFTVRVRMPAGFVYTGKRSIGAAVTEPTLGAAGAFDVRVRTYLQGALQEDLNVIGLGIRAGNGTGQFAFHWATATAPFDSLEYVFVPELLTQPVAVTLHEFCVNPEA